MIFFTNIFKILTSKLLLRSSDFISSSWISIEIPLITTISTRSWTDFCVKMLLFKFEVNFVKNVNASGC